MAEIYDILIVGGGAAGFFAAITAAEKKTGLRIAILEKGKSVLQKVKISGGGRCNFTHACFDPKELCSHYPRGSRELLGPFHSFAPGDTIAWFESRGVESKIEADGRMFPTSDDAQSIVDCLQQAARQAGVSISLQHNVRDIVAPSSQNPVWTLKMANGLFQHAHRLMVASGSNLHIWKNCQKLGHRLVEPVASLYTFNIKDKRIAGLAGLSIPNTQIQVVGLPLQASGPTLITHWGLSGPAILRLSAWGARMLHAQNYSFPIEVNWLGTRSYDEMLSQLKEMKAQLAKRQVSSPNTLDLPQRLWKKLVTSSQISPQLRWADLKREQVQTLAHTLVKSRFQVEGKSTFKEEFVTAGGIELTEINFKRFESKLHPGLFFAGEVLNIDGITGGFNFQAAWTGGWIAGNAMADSFY